MPGFIYLFKHIIMFCENTKPTALNFYSKNNLVREKKNITSLYTLIAKAPEHSNAIVENFRFKLALPSRDNGLHRNESTKQLNASSSLKYFHLSGLHQYQQINIIKEAHMDTLSRNQSVKSIASRRSFIQVESWKSRARKNSYRVEEDHQVLGSVQNDCQSDGLEELAESVFRDGEGPEQMKTESLVIDKVGISTVQKITNPEFFSHQSTPFLHAEPESYPHKQSLQSNSQSKILISPEPLQPQISSSLLTINQMPSTIIQTQQIQIPDKLQNIQADLEYDQKDFFELTDSPIELIKEDTNRHLSSEFGFDCNKDEQLNKELIGFRKTENELLIEQKQRQVAVQSQGQQEAVLAIEELQPPKPKKMNFKAMMSKHKKAQTEEEKQIRKKRLLLNFFDQN